MAVVRRNGRPGRDVLVILSEAKDHLATLDPRKKILRFAQDDTLAGGPGLEYERH